VQNYCAGIARNNIMVMIPKIELQEYLLQQKNEE